MDAKDLIKDFLTWYKDTVVQKRIENGEVGYDWCYKDINFDDELTIEAFQTFFDRQDKNDQYKQFYEQKSLDGKKAYAWLQHEINLIYSFHKCFAMRNHTRLQLYRNDLSQKGARVRSAVNIGLGKFLYKKDAVEKDE